MRELNLKYINPFTLVRDLLFNWWVILLAAVVGFCGCFVYYSAFVVKTYTSSMTISVNLSGYTSNSTASSLARTIEIADSYQKVLNSQALVQIVEKELGEKITGKLSAVQHEETNLIQLSVTDISPEKAFKTLKTVFKNYNILTDSAFTGVIISVISNPNMPLSVSNTAKKLKDSCLFAVVGVLIAVLLILIISFFRDTVKNISDVDSLIDAKLFGTIPHINKKKSKIKKKEDGLLMTNPLIDFGFSNSFRTMAVKLESLHRTKRIKTISFSSIAENEGKTTVSVNTAIALAENGHKVLIIDTDLKLPAVYKFFGKDEVLPETEFGEYIKGKLRYENVIRKDPKTKVWLAVGKQAYRNSSELINSERYTEFLKRAREEFDFVIIDTPPGGVAVDAEIMSEKVDGMLFVVRQDFAFVEAINRYVSDIDPDKMLGCVFNDYHELRIGKRSEESV